MYLTRRKRSFNRIAVKYCAYLYVYRSLRVYMCVHCTYVYIFIGCGDGGAKLSKTFQFFVAITPFLFLISFFAAVFLRNSIVPIHANVTYTNTHIYIFKDFFLFFPLYPVCSFANKIV